MINTVKNTQRDTTTRLLDVNPMSVVERGRTENNTNQSIIRLSAKYLHGKIAIVEVTDRRDTRGRVWVSETDQGVNYDRRKK